MIKKIKKLIVILLSCLTMASCGYPLIGKGYARLVDNNCAPIKDKKISVNSIEYARFLRSGHLTDQHYTTDKEGRFAFDIEKSADRMTLFLQDEVEQKDVTWNWYTATSNKDVVLYHFDTSMRPGVPDFKEALLKTVPAKPLNIVYPYEKGKCTNYKELQAFNRQKFIADQKAAKEAKEKARIDAIVEVIPTFTVAGYGVIERSINRDGENIMTSTIPTVSNRVLKEHQKMYDSFGMFIDVSQSAVLKHPDDITMTTIYPEPGLTDPRTGKTKKSRTINYGEMSLPHSGNKPFRFEMSVVFNRPWKIVTGEWVMQIKVKEKIVVEQKFIVE